MATMTEDTPEVSARVIVTSLVSFPLFRMIEDYLGIGLLRNPDGVVCDVCHTIEVVGESAGNIGAGVEQIWSETRVC